MTTPTSSRLSPLLRRIAEDLDALGQQWALVGGCAVHAHTRAGATDDIDIAVAVGQDEDAEALVNALQQRGYTAVTSVEDEGTGRLASVLLNLAEEGDECPPLQLLFASSGIEPEIARDAAAGSALDGVRVPVASVGHLLALKVLSSGDGRPQDREDIAALLRQASQDDLQQARDALVVLSDRGFARDRDLCGEFDRIANTGA